MSRALRSLRRTPALLMTAALTLNAGATPATLGVHAGALEAATLPAPAAQSLDQVARSIERVTFSNGLRLVLAPEAAANTVGVSVTYAVGSRDEGARQSGFAHLFEHMMFQGSQHVPKGLHFKLIAQRGGSLNGTTSPDRTNYYEVLPSSELALALWLEADRMRALSVTRENFENQRAVVQEEFRMRYSGSAYMTGMIRLNELVFADYPPYRHPTIGSMEDLANAKLQWVKGFYARNYTPDKAVLTIAGKFERDEALRLVRHYFGDIRKEGPAREPLPAMPGEVEPRQAQLEDNNAKTPGFYFGFLIPPSRTSEHYPLELAALVLADGESSRLWRSLVREKAVAQQVFAWTGGNVGPDVLGIFVALTENARLEDVQALVASELQRLAEEPVPEAELQKIKTRLASAFVFGLQTNLSRATRLGEYEALYGDGRLLLREPARYGAVTPGRLRAAVRAYLGRERRQLVEVLPGGDATARAAASVSGDSR